MDPVKSWIVKGKEFYSKGKITPFESMELKGLIVKTILRGKVIYTAGEGIKVEGGYGRLVKKEAG
jgi:dihydroorotase-like cyclic amidohydrolase